MNILALDISKSRTGAAIGDATAAPRLFDTTISGQRHGQTYFAFYQWVRDVIVLEKPDLIVYEAALFLANSKAAADAARVLMGLGATLEMVCAARQIDHQSVAVPTWRKSFLGHGRPVDPKRAALEMCAMIGWETQGVHDRAEAAGVWAHGHLKYGNARAVRRLLSDASVRRMGT